MYSKSFVERKTIKKENSLSKSTQNANLPVNLSYLTPKFYYLYFNLDEADINEVNP
jgi:hypothetical protein